MKKIVFIMGVIVLSAMTISVQAQQTWDAKKNPTVGAITTKYDGKLLPARPALTTEDIFPVIGKYESATNTDAASVTISLDAENKGLVWIEGLPQGKIKAMLRKSPSTYKIPAQQTEDGKDVAEGTAVFDKETNTLSICIGKNYNAADPSAAFMPEAVEETVATTVVVKGKTNKTKVVASPKPWIYTGTKVEKAMVVN